MHSILPPLERRLRFDPKNSGRKRRESLGSRLIRVVSLIGCYLSAKIKQQPIRERHYIVLSYRARTVIIVHEFHGWNIRFRLYEILNCLGPGPLVVEKPLRFYNDCAPFSKEVFKNMPGTKQNETNVCNVGLPARMSILNNLA